MSSKPKPNWLDLPPDVTGNILHRLGPIFILQNAQKVCTTWYNICKDPAMWRVIHIQNPRDSNLRFNLKIDLHKLCMHAVDRSQGQLAEICIDDISGTIDLLHYIADRSCKLKRLELAFFDWFGGDFGELLQKLPLLEELTLSFMDVLSEDIEVLGRCCPNLKTLKIDSECFGLHDDRVAIAISKRLPNLRHLQLIGDKMSNIGLQAILDSCHHLESLDLRMCHNFSLDNGDLKKRCREQIKCVRLRDDSMEDHKFDFHMYYVDDPLWFHYYDPYDYDGFYGCNIADFDDLAEYEEDFTEFEGINNCEKDLIEWANFKATFEKSYEIKTKERKKGHIRKVLSKRRKKSIRNLPSKWKQNVMFDKSYHKERKTRPCLKSFDLEY